MQDRQSSPEITSQKIPETFSIMTFNIACLPFLGAINAKFLKLNHYRTELIIKRILEWNNNADKKTAEGMAAPDVICFQEAIAVESRLLLKQKLSEGKNSPYPYNTDHLGTRLRSSGLHLFSKYPILESTFVQYNNQKFGDESLAIKGFIGVKLKVTEKEFVTVFTTHLEAGGAIIPNKQKNLTGKTNSYERGEEMGLISNAIKTWGIYPPEDHKDMQHCKTFVCGDFNTTLNNERRMNSISTGKAKNRFKKGMIKYPGQHDLFQHLEHTIPINFIETLDDAHYNVHNKKEVVPELLEIAKKENKFIGSTLSTTITKENKDSNKVIKPYDAQPKVIDGVFCSQFKPQQQQDWAICDAPGKFESKILSFKLNGEGGESDISLSDHFPVLGTWRPGLFQTTPTPSNPVKTEPPAQQSKCLIM